MTKTTLDELNANAPKGVKYSTDPLPNREAIIHFKGKTLLTSQNYLDVKAYEHALAFTVAKMMDEDLLKETRDAILSAMENGTDFRDFKRTLMPYLMAKGWLAPSFKNDNVDDDKETFKAYQKHLGRRLRTIYHTNIHSSYSAGQWQRIQQTKEFLPFLQYMPSVSAKKRDNHTRYYGLLRPVDDPIWQYIFPPNGYGCKCWVKQLTRKQAEKIQFQQAKDVSNGKADRFELEMETVENPRTGEKMTTPKGVHFSFAHNHDRLTALLKLAEDKHGTEFGGRLREKLTENMLEYAVKNSAVTVVSFAGITARPAEVARLTAEGVRQSEAELADQWQQHYQVEIVGFEQGVHKMLNPPNPPDLALVDKAVAPIEWKTLDIMYTLESHANVVEFNKGFHKSTKAWEKAKANIIKHIDKADIVPMYLDHMDTKTVVRIIGFVLSLSKEQQKKIVFVWGNKP